MCYSLFSSTYSHINSNEFGFAEEIKQHSSANGNRQGLRRSGVGKIQLARIKTLKMTVVIGEVLFLIRLHEVISNCTHYVTSSYINLSFDILFRFRFSMCFCYVLDAVLRHILLVVVSQVCIFIKKINVTNVLCYAK